MSGTSVNLGKQEVSIYPGQTLSSVYGSAVLNDVVPIGVMGCNVTLEESGSNITFHVSAGSTFVFKRSAPDPITLTAGNPIIGKITLADVASKTFAKSAFWSTSEYDTLYIVADWQFDSVNKFVNFSVETNTSIGSIKDADGTDSHKLVVASLLNNKFFSDNWAEDNTNQDIANYHIVQDFVSNRDILNLTSNSLSSFPIFFDSYGRGVYVGSGTASLGGKVVNYASAFYQGKSYPTRGELTYNGITLPAIGSRFYVSNEFTNAKIDVIATNTKSSYYQIDFLRLTEDFNHSTVLTWESFLKTSGSLDFSGNTLTKSQVTAYLSSNYFNLKTEGLTLAIVVRQRSTIPETQGATNIIWPEWTLIPKYDLNKEIPSVSTGTKLKAPIYRSEDIGL